MQFTKSHALGNDYLVLDARNYPEPPDSADIVVICDRHYGPGSDGILYGPTLSKKADFGLRIFNPDGSEAEKSGNGLRIFARYLWNQDLVGEKPFTVETEGGVVTCVVNDYDSKITVDMGEVSFFNKDIPVEGPQREVLAETLEVRGKPYTFYAATIGNPHCILPMDKISKEIACELGPVIEKLPIFPKRTNVQFMKVLDRKNIRIEIWERGAGYTYSSGSSSSAAAAVAFKMGACEASIDVHMPGGIVHVDIDKDYNIQMTGPVTRVGTFEIHPEAFSHDIPER